MQGRIVALAEFAARARTHMPRDGYTKDIKYVPEPEASTRLSQQLGQLAKGSAVLAGRLTANDADCKVAVRAGKDSIPATRRKIIAALIARKTLSDVDLPDSTRFYATEDLECQGLLQGGVLSPLARDLLHQASIL
jgi:hypothetical protein